MKIERYKRFWAVLDETGELICLYVCTKKALTEVVRRLSAPTPFSKA